MKRLVIVSEFCPPAYEAGGPVRSIEALLDTYQGTCKIVLVSRRGDLNTLSGQSTREAARGATINFVSSRKEVLREALKAIDKDTCLYLNSFFNLNFSIIPLVAWRTLGRKPCQKNPPFIVLAPRGELDPGALAIKSTKKRLYLRTAKLLSLHRNVVWHATSRLEEQSIRRIFHNAKIVTVPNVTLLSQTSELPSVENRVLRLIYASRITPKKGLHILIDALNSTTIPFELDIYGTHRPDEVSYLEFCKRKSTGTVKPSIRFHGPLSHEKLMEALANYDLMPLPTAGENFGHTLIEALQHSVPLMIPDTTPWTHAALETGTLIPDMSPDSWSKALDDFGKLSSQERKLRRLKAGQAYQSYVSSQQGASHLFDVIEKKWHDELRK